jgi:hypothetical protein
VLCPFRKNFEPSDFSLLPEVLVKDVNEIVILHVLIASETERNREAVRTAQNMYYEKFVKPYEDREGIVVQDWREYNEEFIADHTRGN